MFTGCQKVKFDNLAVKYPLKFFIPHMPTDITHDLSKKKTFFRTAILGIALDIQNTFFTGHPVKLKILQKSKNVWIS